LGFEADFLTCDDKAEAKKQAFNLAIKTKKCQKLRFSRLQYFALAKT